MWEQKIASKKWHRQNSLKYFERELMESDVELLLRVPDEDWDII